MEKIVQPCELVNSVTSNSWLDASRIPGIDKSRALVTPFLMSRIASRLTPLLIATFLGFLYFRTLAPGLTWANDGADGGDLITAVITGGVPHPTGYPTYLVLASVFLQIPVGSLAFRTNLLSLTAAIVAAWLMYVLVRAVTGSVFAGSVASLAFGTAPLIWSQAIITEVYTLQALLMVGFLALLFARQPLPLSDIALGLVGGFGLGNHLMGVFLVPLLLLRLGSSNWTDAQNSAPKTSHPTSPSVSYLRRLLGLAAGLSIYLIIPLRAISHAPVNWGLADTPQAFARLITGQMYWTRLSQPDAEYLISGIRSWAHLLVEQLGLVGLLLAVFGLIVLFRPNALNWVTLWIALSSSILSILYSSPDSYVYAIPVIISCSIWIGLASAWLLNWSTRRVTFNGVVLVCLVVGFFVVRGFAAVPRMDLSRDQQAENFAQAVLSAAPQSAIILSTGDEATFSLWYFHFAYRERPDLVVVSTDLLTQAWYQDVLKQTYPSLIVPVGSWLSALPQANPDRPVCQVTSINPPRLECLERSLYQDWAT